MALEELKEEASKLEYFDLDLFIKCAKEYGAEIRPAKPGHGGIYVNGKKITKAEDLFNDLGKDENERST